MNPYTSLWTGVRDGDGPREFHLVLLDNGRTAALADEVGRQALRCIRCSACLNVCPVYSRVGGHAYESVYPGPDRRDPHPTAVGNGGGRVAALRVVAVRGVRRRLPGEDRDPAAAGAPARARAGRGAAVDPEKVAMRGLYRAFVDPRGLRARAAAGPLAASRPLARDGRHHPGAGAARGLDDVARPAGAGAGELPGLVAAKARSSPKRARQVTADQATRFRQLSVNRASAGASRKRAGCRPPPRVRPCSRASRAALAGAPAAPEPAARVPHPGRAQRNETIALFAERVAEYKATVHRLSERAIAATRGTSICDDRGARRLGVPPGLPAEWRPEASGARRGRRPRPHELDGLDGALTGGRRRRSPRPAPSCWTAGPPRAGARSRSFPTCTSAWCAAGRSSGSCPRPSNGSSPPCASAARLPWCRGRRPHRTSSSTGWRGPRAADLARTVVEIEMLPGHVRTVFLRHHRLRGDGARPPRPRGASPPGARGHPPRPPAWPRPQAGAAAGGGGRSTARHRAAPARQRQRRGGSRRYRRG